MPIAILTATSNVSGFNSWTLTSGSNKWSALNSDDITSRISAFSANLNQLEEWTDLPTAARGAVISQVEFESCTRAPSGIGFVRHFMRDPGTTDTFIGVIMSPGAPGGGACTRATEVTTADANGDLWTQPQVDAHQYGVRSGSSVGTSVQAMFETINVTYIPTMRSGIVDGISWLGPLVLAGLRGLNLFSESTERLTLFERNVFRLIYRKAGIRVYPALMNPEEREKVLWELFKQPTYAF